MTTTVSAPLNHPLRRVIGHCSYRLGHTTSKIIKTELGHVKLKVGFSSKCFHLVVDVAEATGYPKRRRP